MAESTGRTRSLASRAGSVARRVVGRTTSNGGAADAAPAEKSPAARKAPAKKAPATKAPAKKTPATKTTATKAPAKKTAATKAPAKKTPAKKATATKATATKATATKTPAKKATKVVAAVPTTGTPTKKAAVAKTTTTKAPVKAAVKKAPAKKDTPVKASVSKAPADVVTTEAGATPPTPARRARRGSASALVVRPGEDPWTKEELAEVRTHLRDDVKRLVPELGAAEEELHHLMVDSGDGAGHDQADVGSSTFERDQELTIAANAREMLLQSEHALERIEDGSYGVCEGCGEAIGKMRLMAFPRATLCLSCKQREERR